MPVQVRLIGSASEVEGVVEALRCGLVVGSVRGPYTARGEDGAVRVYAEVSLPGGGSAAADQRWFWTEWWQEGEREASRDIAAGRTTFHGSTEQFLAHLDERIDGGGRRG